MVGGSVVEIVFFGNTLAAKQYPLLDTTVGEFGFYHLNGVVFKEIVNYSTSVVLFSSNILFPKSIKAKNLV